MSALLVLALSPFPRLGFAAGEVGAQCLGLPLLPGRRGALASRAQLRFLDGFVGHSQRVGAGRHAVKVAKQAWLLYLPPRALP